MYALRDGAEHRHVKSSLAERMRLNAQIHTKCVKMWRLVIIHVNPRRLCNKLM